MNGDDELLCIRKVASPTNTVTLPDPLKKYTRVVFKKERSSGRIYAKGIEDGENGESE